MILITLLALKLKMLVLELKESNQAPALVDMFLISLTRLVPYRIKPQTKSNLISISLTRLETDLGRAVYRILVQRCALTVALKR